MDGQNRTGDIQPYFFTGCAVVLDSEKRILLKKDPKRGWELPGGDVESHESMPRAVVREVKEETGVDATIVSLLPGEYLGGTSVTRYFLMTAEVGAGGVAPDDKETAVKWMTPAEARQHIMQTTNTTGRKRDLAVLDTALAIRET